MEQKDTFEGHLTFFYNKIFDTVKSFEFKSALDPMTTLEITASVLLTIQMEVLDHIYQHYVVDQYKDEFKKYVEDHLHQAIQTFFQNNTGSDVKPLDLGNIIPFKRK